MAKKRAGALGHRKGQTWSTYVTKVPPVVTPGPYAITPSAPIAPSVDPYSVIGAS